MANEIKWGTTLIYALLGLYYMILYVYKERKGVLNIQDGIITKYTFWGITKCINIDEISWAKCDGSEYVIRSAVKEMFIDLFHIHKNDVPEVEQILTELVMSVPSYKYV